jgi:hypothetical protein
MTSAGHSIGTQNLLTELARMELGYYLLHKFK